MVTGTDDGRSRPDVFEWAFLSLALVLAAIHLYLGLFAAFVPDERVSTFLVIGVVLLVGPLVYVTPYWHSLLYLLGAGLAVYLGVIWLLGGMKFVFVGALTGAVATAFALLALYLFVRETVPSDQT